MSYVGERLRRCKLDTASANDGRGGLRGEREVQIKFTDFRFERRQFVGFGKARRRQDVPQLACFRDEC